MVVAEAPIAGHGGPVPISYVTSAIHSEQAGTEGHLLRLIRSMDRTRFAPKLILMQETDWAKSFHDHLVPLETLGFQSWSRPRDWRVISELARRFRKDGTQIVELHSVEAHFVGAMAAHLAKVPVVISCRRNSGHQLGLKERVLSRWGNRYVTQFLANADFVADRISEIEGIDRSRFQVIHNGVSLDRFEPGTHAQVSAEFEQRTQGKRVISIVANLRPVKNYPFFLQAAKLVAQKHSDVVFAVMGEGPLKSELQSLANNLGIEHQVLWLDSVPCPGPYLLRSTIACLSSKSEGFSNAILEYMAASLPVVATNVGGAAEAIVEGTTGYIVPANSPAVMADRLLQLLEMDETDRQQMGRLGRERVENYFTMEGQLRAFQDLYWRQLQLAGI